MLLLCSCHGTPKQDHHRAGMVSEANTSGFVGYKLDNLDHNPTHGSIGEGKMALRSQGNGFLKGNTASRVAQALAFRDWVKVYNF